MSPTKLILALAVAATAASESFAQTATRRWAVVLEIGVLRSSASGAVEGAMRDAGYDDTTPPMCLFGYCSAGVGHPQSSGPEPFVTGVSVRYALRPGLQLRAVLAPTASLGSTTGYRANPGQPFGGDFVDLQSQVGSFAIVVAPVTGDAAWIEFGPAFVRGDVRTGGGSSLASGTLPGLLVGAGLNLTPGRRMTFEVAARYRLAGSLSVASFGPTGTAVDVPLSYATLGGNVGIRF